MNEKEQRNNRHDARADVEFWGDTALWDGWGPSKQSLEDTVRAGKLMNLACYSRV